jgi:hypothetical protein
VNAARDLAANGFAPKVAQAGGAVVEVLAAYGGAQPSKSNLDSWINSPGVVTSSMRDPDSMAGQTINALVRREYCYVVDLKTMKILHVYIGTTDGSMPNGISSSAVCGMCDLLGRLGAPTTGCPAGC